MHATLPLLIESDFPAIRRRSLETLQVNLGYLCNQQCLHCHVNAGPNRKELMDETTIASVLQYLQNSTATTLDLTGGAPELNPHFRDLVVAARKMGCKVIDRCNLTVLFEDSQQDLAGFLADNQVEITASLPCYLEENVDAQRGKGVFANSIAALRRLNDLGYAREGSGLKLNLVFNPQDATLPPPQCSLQSDYKKFLSDSYSIEFNDLFTITNMPIKRFGSTLVSKGTFHSYMDLLKQSSTEENLENVMCKSLVSIDWQGYVYDCDFNQMLELGLPSVKQRVHITDIMGMDLEGQPIAVADHCYACTAGQGSSCGGALAS